MEYAVSSKLENIFTENVDRLACRICFSFDNVQEAYQCSYNGQTILEIINILLSRVSSINLEKLCMNCIKAVINVHLFVQNLNDRKTFWEKALSSLRTKSAQTILLPTNNYTLYDEKLLQFDEVSIKKEENIGGKNSDSEYVDYELIIKDELVGLADDREQTGDMPDCCDIDDDNNDGSIFNDEDDVSCTKLAPTATFDANTNSYIRVEKEISLADDDSKLKAKSFTADTSKTKKEENTTKPTPTKKVCDKMCSPGSNKTRGMRDIGRFSVNEKYEFADHVKQHDKTDPLVGRICDTVHDNLCDYKNHMKIHSVKPIFYRDLDLNSDVNECKECGKTFALAVSLFSHMRTHKKKTGTWCTFCQKGFPATSYRMHMRTHTEERRYACLRCPKRFKTKGIMKTHMSCHENKRPYPCPRCPKQFKTKGIMKTHVACHENKRPFACPLCSKQFTTRDAVKVHVACHENKREFRCELCPKAFNYYTSLYNHHKSHSNKKFPMPVL